MSINTRDKSEHQLAELAQLRARVRELESASSNRESTADFHEMTFEQSHMLVAFLDTDFKFIKVNAAYAKADTREQEFFPGRGHFELFPNEENEVIFRRVLETGQAHQSFAKPFEYAESPERGVSHWDWSLLPLKRETGKIHGLVLTLVDVTERVTATEEYRRSLENFRRLGMAI
jgi:PAS domain S-box-containing protein